jgi:hypothetical protein
MPSSVGEVSLAQNLSASTNEFGAQGWIQLAQLDSIDGMCLCETSVYLLTASSPSAITRLPQRGNAAPQTFRMEGRFIALSAATGSHMCALDENFRVHMVRSPRLREGVLLT